MTNIDFNKITNTNVDEIDEIIKYKELIENEINENLFDGFIRKQIVTKCWRKIDNEWIIVDDNFVDDWQSIHYRILSGYLKNTIKSGGVVYGAFVNNKLKGFVSVEGKPIGSSNQYMDLSSIHISQDYRRHGIGFKLFEMAKEFARSKNIPKLYISAHSAVESQAFYKAMGCVEAKEYIQFHVEKEPYDCQLECEL